MNCKYCGAEISKRSKTLLCRSCARKAWSKQRIKIGTVWKRPSDNYYVIKIGKGSGRDGIVEYHRWLMEHKQALIQGRIYPAFFCSRRTI
jgi:hypothetical protein